MDLFLFNDPLPLLTRAPFGACGGGVKEDLEDCGVGREI